MQVSDYQISARVRSVLARYWIDTTALRFGSFRGVVRLTGELQRLGGHDSTNEQLLSHLGTIELDIRRVPGVKQVYFQLDNASKGDSGDWQLSASDEDVTGAAGPSGLEESIQGEGKVFEVEKLPEFDDELETKKKEATQRRR